MPDFSAISSLIGGIKNILDGVTGFAGSLGGDDLMGNLIDLGSVEAPAA
ncbi:hypothetical protein ACWIE7_05210 [Dietzia sp. NPDC055343]